MDRKTPPASKMPGKRRVQVLASEQAGPLRLIHSILGLVLVVAGAIKLYELGFKAQDERTSTLLLMVLAEAELLGGLFMVVGFAPVRAHPWVVAVFAAYAATSLLQALSGKSSCGFFGSLSIGPWYALIFALAAGAALLAYGPPTDWRAVSYSRAGRLFGLGLVVLFTGFAGWQQAGLVTVTGTAMVGERPLEEATLIFHGEPDTLVLRTNKEGAFRLPLVRPGRYIVSIAEGLPPTKSEPSNSAAEKKKKFPQRSRRPAAHTIPPVLPGSHLWIEVSRNSEYNRLLKF
jgi:hypothetical protein